jgi:putative effector of murein hydrolase
MKVEKKEARGFSMGFSSKGNGTVYA